MSFSGGNQKVTRIFFAFMLTLLFLGQPFGITSNLYCQNDGFHYSRNYTPLDYVGHAQNWSVLQDKRGIIYIGNHKGVIEFDGVSWRKIDVPNLNVRSLSIDDTGTIYVGGNDEFGFLEPDSREVLNYVSLLEHLVKTERNFSNVWRTHWTKEGVYFRTSKFLFRWNPGSKQLKEWEAGQKYKFNFSFTNDGKLLIHKRQIGLMQMKNDSLELVPGGEKFTAIKISMMAHFDSKKLLIGTRSKGFYIYDGIESEPFPTEADSYIKEKRISHGIRLSSGDFALATLRGGLVVIDSRGNLKQILDKASGLQDDNVKYVFQDSQGNLWLALGNGISKIEYLSRISIYDDRSNLFGNVQTVSMHGLENVLYAGTDKGLYYLVSPGKFRLIPGLSRNCWSLLSVEDSLLVATSDGVFQVDNKNNSIQGVTKKSSYVLHRSRKDPNRVWVGTRDGLVSLYLNSKDKSNRWILERIFEEVTQEIRTIAEDKSGNLWLGIRTKGVMKVELSSNKTIMNPVVTRYGKSHVLPPGENHVFSAAGHVMFATDKGIFRFEPKNNIFLPDTTLGDEYTGNKGKGVFCIAEDKNKHIWLHSQSRNIQAIPRPDGTYRIDKTPFLRVPDVQVNFIFPDPDGNIIWFARNNNLMRYNTGIKKNYRQDYNTIIRKVLVNGNPVFYGYGYKEFLPEIPYRDRNLRFEFAAPFFEDEASTRYRCILEGYETEWSGFTGETWKDYTNLDSGLYTFRVQAQNVYRHTGKDEVFQFKILPPWYYTWWAFLLYGLMVSLAIFLTARWRAKEIEKRRLLQVIEERAEEIDRKNQQLEKQTSLLQEQAEKLKELDHAKSRFFANISHEFRTPLTLITGPLENMIDACPGDIKDKKRTLFMMLRNAQRLLRLIDQLLELSKLDSGRMKLQAVKSNIVSFVKGITDSFEMLARQNEIDLVFLPGTLNEDQEENNAITLYFDHRKMEDVISNLLMNAVKFTPAGGKITVGVKANPTGASNFPAGFVDISVNDTGPGIPAAQLSSIFKRFYQADSTFELHSKGTGIGLALARELVELHHGTIKAESGSGKGSEFTIRLPMGSEHLSAEEIVGQPPSQSLTRKKISLEIETFDTAEDEDEEGYENETADDNESKTGTDKKNIILVVEDSADVRDYIRGELEPDYKVVDAASGKEGIEKAGEIIPDLIVSDIMMPETDGLELCRVLKEDISTSHIPVILLTAKASEESVVEGLETGADDYVTKPFSSNILKARIKNLIDLRKQLHQSFNREMTRQPVEISMSTIDKEFVKKLKTVIEENLSDPEFNVNDMSNKLNMSQPTLYRKIQALSGESPTDFIRSYRLKWASQLLESNFGSVTEVAFEVGFSSRAYFTKCFKDKFHRLPSSYLSGS
jgi:signal transduction histidine kinase/DNA-binding response OmpR family regulator/ligand-binding sensor domain-containing protein